MTVNHEYPLKNTGVSNTINSQYLPRHRWYSYKEGFSPTLVQHAISSIPDFKQDSDLILDPFNGSGTVTLFSSLQGFNATGYEVNPFSSFISKVKEVALGTSEIQQVDIEKDKVVKYCKALKKSPLRSISTFSEGNDKEKWLFNSSVLDSYEAGFQYVKTIQNSKIKSLLKLALISSAMENCNAKKDGKCLRYKNNWQNLNLNYITLIDSFEKNISLYLNDIKGNQIQTSSKIINGDSRSLIFKNQTKFRLCITSPPYLNSFDYTDIYRPELFLGEFITSPKKLLNLRHRTLRSHVNHLEKFDPTKDFGTVYNNVVNSLSSDTKNSWGSRIPAMVQSYFSDMEVMLKGLRRRAQPDAQLWLIVANSAYSDFEIPTDLILAEIGARTNWYLQEVGVLRYLHKRGSKYSPNVSSLRESVIIFNASRKVGKNRQ